MKIENEDQLGVIQVLINFLINLVDEYNIDRGLEEEKII